MALLSTGTQDPQLNVPLATHTFISVCRIIQNFGLWHILTSYYRKPIALASSTKSEVRFLGSLLSSIWPLCSNQFFFIKGERNLASFWLATDVLNHLPLPLSSYLLVQPLAACSNILDSLLFILYPRISPVSTNKTQTKHAWDSQYPKIRGDHNVAPYFLMKKCILVYSVFTRKYTCSHLFFPEDIQL